MPYNDAADAKRTKKIMIIVKIIRLLYSSVTIRIFYSYFQFFIALKNGEVHMSSPDHRIF
jgi:hypothetical protein